MVGKQSTLCHVGGSCKWSVAQQVRSPTWLWKSPEAESHYRTLCRCRFGVSCASESEAENKRAGWIHAWQQVISPDSIARPQIRHSAKEPPSHPGWWSLNHSNLFSELSLPAIYLLQKSLLLFYFWKPSCLPAFREAPGCVHILVYFMIGEFWNTDQLLSMLQKAEGLKAARWWQEWMSESTEASPSC